MAQLGRAAHGHEADHRLARHRVVEHAGIDDRRLHTAVVACCGDDDQPVVLADEAADALDVNGAASHARLAIFLARSCSSLTSNGDPALVVTSVIAPRPARKYTRSA